MADNLGPMAWLFLPENEQVQYLQKIALRAENPFGPKCNWIWTNKYFLRQQFSATIEAAHFPAVETGHWPAVSCHFHKNNSVKAN